MSFVMAIAGTLYLISAVIVIVSRTSFQGVIWFGIMGSISSLIMLMAGAPDVAMTQFAVGVALVLIVYIMALRKQRRVRMGYISVPSMIENTPSGLRGLEWDVLQHIDEKEGYHVEAIGFRTKEEGMKAVVNHSIDLLCGALTEDDVSRETKGLPYLETSIFLCEDEKIDFVRLKHKTRGATFPEPVFHKKSNYVLVVSRNSEDLIRDLLEGIQDLHESGKIKEIVGRYL